MSPRFRTGRRQLPGAAVLELHGEFDMARVEEVEAELSRIDADGAVDRTVLDLRGLTFLDSSGLRVIVLASQRARESGTPLIVVRGNPQVQHVFEITGMDQVVAFVDEPAEPIPGAES